MNSSNTTIITPTGDLGASRAFYEKLGFQLVSEAPILYGDGQFLVEVEPDRFARAGLKFYNEGGWEDEIAELRKRTHVEELSTVAIASDPNGVKVYLSKSPRPEPEFPKEKSNALTGAFAGIGIEAVDCGRTAEFWECLGYGVKEGSVESGFVTYSNDSSAIGISVMKVNSCPHLFFNPGLTFFNGGNNPEIIEGIRAAGIPITEEITIFNSKGIVDNIIIRDPGGLGFFLFND